MKKASAKKTTTYKLVLTAVMAAVATLLNQFAVIQLPFGGGVTVFSQVPVITVGFIFGPVWGLACGFVMSLSQLLFGLSNFSYVKGLGTYVLVAAFDYIVPYTVLGLGGMFKGKIKNASAAIAVGSVCVSFFRFLCHWISGAVVWGEWMPEEFLGLDMTNTWVYSALYNGAYMALETVVTVIGAVALSKALFPRLDENGMLK